MGAKIEQKSIQNRGANLQATKITSWSRLGAILGRFPSRRGVKSVDCSLVFKGFREHPFFDKDECPRAI